MNKSQGAGLLATVLFIIMIVFVGLWYMQDFRFNKNYSLNEEVYLGDSSLVTIVNYSTNPINADFVVKNKNGLIFEIKQNYIIGRKK